MCEVHGLAPQRVDRRALADQAAGDRPAVDPDPDGQLTAVVIVEPLDDLGQLPGVGDGAAGMVDPGYDQSAGGEQAVVLHAAHLFDAVPFGCATESLDQRVQHGDRVTGGQAPSELVEPEKLGVDHRHVAVLGADVLLALPEAPGDRLGHQAREQLVVLPLLLVDELLLGLQAGAHVVERRRQLAELVGGADRYGGAEIATADPAHRLGELLDGPREYPGEKHRQQAHREHDRCGGQGDVAGEPAHRRQRLGPVDLGHDRPVQAGNLQRGVGQQRLGTQVTLGRDDSALPGQGEVDGGRAHRLQQHAVADLDLPLRHGRVGAVGHHVGPVTLGVLEQLPRHRPHHPVRPGQVGLPRAAQTLRLPAPFAGHDVVDARGGELQGENPVDPGVVADRGEHPRGRRAVGGGVSLEVGEDHLVDRGRAHRPAVGVGEVGGGVRRGQHVGAQVDLLVGRIDDVAGGVDQHHVVETETLGVVGEERLILGVESGPAAGIPG